MRASVRRRSCWGVTHSCSLRAHGPSPSQPTAVTLSVLFCSVSHTAFIFHQLIGTLLWPVVMMGSEASVLAVPGDPSCAAASAWALAFVPFTQTEDCKAIVGPVILLLICLHPAETKGLWEMQNWDSAWVWPQPNYTPLPPNLCKFSRSSEVDARFLLQQSFKVCCQRTSYDDAVQYF